MNSSLPHPSAIALVLAAIVHALVDTPFPAAAQAPPGSPPGTFTLPGLHELPQTRERPLFSVTRRPPPAAPPAPARPVPPAAPPTVATKAPAAALILTGIAHGPDTRFAILRNAGTNTVTRVQKGQTVDGWSVEEIEPRSVLLRNGGATQRLELFRVPVPKR